jgi:hypothetical protein
MKRISGLKLLDEREGAGTPAKKDDRVVYNIRIFLNQGEEVPLNDIQAKQLPKEMVRGEDGVTFIDHTILLGHRQAIAGVEHALDGYESRRLSEGSCEPAPGLSKQRHPGSDSSRGSADR